MRSTGLIAVAAALVLAVPAGAHEGEMGLGDALPALPSSSDPAQSGSFGAPFAEPTVGGVATEDRCVVNSDGLRTCKPAAGSVSVLPNGTDRLLERARGHGADRAVADHRLRQRRPQRPDARAEHLRQPVRLERPGRPLTAAPTRAATTTARSFPAATARRTTTARCSAPTTRSCPTDASSPSAAPPTTRTRRSPTRGSASWSSRACATPAIYNPATNRWTPDRLHGGRALVPEPGHARQRQAVRRERGREARQAGVPRPPRRTRSPTSAGPRPTTPRAASGRDNGTAAAQRSLPLFPRLHLLPNGHVYYNAAGQSFNPLGQSYDEALWNNAASYDPATGRWKDLGIPGARRRPALGGLLDLDSRRSRCPTSPSSAYRAAARASRCPASAARPSRSCSRSSPTRRGRYTKASFLTGGGVLEPAEPGQLLLHQRQPHHHGGHGRGNAISTRPTGDLHRPRWYPSASCCRRARRWPSPAPTATRSLRRAWSSRSSRPSCGTPSATGGRWRRAISRGPTTTPPRCCRTGGS